MGKVRLGSHVDGMFLFYSHLSSQISRASSFLLRIQPQIDQATYSLIFFVLAQLLLRISQIALLDSIHQEHDLRSIPTVEEGYPGIGLSLRRLPYYDEDYHIGMHQRTSARSAPLPVRELTMMGIIDKSTDKEGWHMMVFDDEVVENWRKGVLAMPDDHFRQLAMCRENASRLKGIIDADSF